MERSYSNEAARATLPRQTSWISIGLAGLIATALLVGAVVLPAGVIVHYRVWAGLLTFWPLPVVAIGVARCRMALVAGDLNGASHAARRWWWSAWIYGLTATGATFFAIDERLGLGLLRQSDLISLLLALFWMIWLLASVATSLWVGVTGLCWWRGAERIPRSRFGFLLY